MSARTSFVKFKEVFKGEMAICAEIGVAGGHNALNMLENMPNMFLHLVDAYKPYFSESDNEKQQGHHDQRKAIAMDKVSPYKDRCAFTLKRSVDAATDFTDGMFDYVYIDGEHTHDAVREDVKAWLPKLKTGGMLAGHDWWLVKDHISDLLQNITSENGKAGEPCDWWITKGE